MHWAGTRSLLNTINYLPYLPLFNMKHIVYKVTNKENGQSYIGATTKSLDERKRDHIQKASEESEIAFHSAIATYGEDAFEWETIDTASSTDELAQKEKHYIQHFESKDEGYNSDRGGGFKKTVYQYDMDTGELTNSYSCLEEASTSVGANKKQISRACLNVNQSFKGYYWSYEKQDPFVPDKDKRRKEVTQFSKDGELIASFNSIADAVLATGINKSCIAKVLRGERKTAGNYYWEDR